MKKHKNMIKKMWRNEGSKSENEKGININQ
jgi:hypothetical protein